jgi:hypothetical protein
MRYLISKCANCGKRIVKRYSDNAQDCSRRLTRLCRCYPRLEVASKYVADGDVLVVLSEKPL